MGKKLYVGNLGFDVTDKDLEAVFAQAGVCESVAVIRLTRSRKVALARPERYTGMWTGQVERSWA